MRASVKGNHDVGSVNRCNSGMVGVGDGHLIASAQRGSGNQRANVVATGRAPRGDPPGVCLRGVHKSWSRGPVRPIDGPHAAFFVG
eukprot:6845346-Lingulodinium_polyedra.AAC.1